MKRKGYVYFIRKANQNIFKIGVTYREPEFRLSELQLNTPDKLSVYGVIYTNKPYKLEKKLHNRYINNKIQGEWFNLSSNEVNFVLEMHPDTTNIDHIELSQRGKRFCYRISTKELYIYLDTLKKMKLNLIYILGLLNLNSIKDNSIYMLNGEILIKYDILIDNYLTFRKELTNHKNKLIICAEKLVKETS